MRCIFHKYCVSQEPHHTTQTIVLQCCDANANVNWTCLRAVLLHCRTLWPRNQLLAVTTCCLTHSHDGASDSSVHLNFQLQWAFMYVDTITHAPMHVWLCDNARAVWQAPCIIALGRELHNNVGLGNACGLGPSEVSSPVKVLLYSLSATLSECVCLTHTERLWEIFRGTTFFHMWRSSEELSLLIWMTKLFKIYTSSACRTVKQC